MNAEEQMLVLAKGREAVSFILKTAPDMLADRKAVEELHDALPAPARPTWSETRELTTLLNEGE